MQDHSFLGEMIPALIALAMGGFVAALGLYTRYQARGGWRPRRD